MKTNITATNIPEIKKGAFVQEYLPEKDEFGNDKYFISNKTGDIWYVRAVRPYIIECINGKGVKKIFSKNSLVTGEIEIAFKSF